jgi:4-amino-4-deoxy-L-arabinose transferase-like glycosyltransferase
MTRQALAYGARPISSLMHLSWLQVAMLLLLLALALRAPSFGATGLDWDESLYIVMAQRWLEGGLPYVAVWDQHPVGLPALLAASTWLMGDGLLAARIASLLAVAGTAALLYGVLARRANAPLAGALAALFYLFYMNRPDGLPANTEVFNNLVITAASLLLLGQFMAGPGNARAGVMFVSGLLLGIGLQFKYVVLPEAVLLCCAVLCKLLRDGERPARTLSLAVLAVAGGLLPTALVTLYFWQAGLLQAYLDANLRANLAYLDSPLTLPTILARLRFGLLPLIGLLPWPMVLLALSRDAKTRERYATLGVWLLLWLIAASLDVAAPLKLWKHYFNALVPPLCLIAGLTVQVLTDRAGPRRQWLVVGHLIVVVVLAPAIGLMVKHFANSWAIDRTNVPRTIAELIGQSGSNGQDIYVFNYDPLVYAYAHAVPPTRFVLGIELSEFSESSGSRPAGEITRILEKAPHWIVVAEPSPYTFTPKVWHELNTTLQSYRLAAVFRELDYIQPPIAVRVFESR